MTNEKANNIDTLTDADKEYLLGITSKDLIDLTVHDIGVLKARRSYLTADQKEYFADALNGTFKGMDYVEPEEDEEDSPKKSKKEKEVKVDDNGKKIFDPDDYTRDVLVQMCKDAGVEFDSKTATKKEMADLLNNR